HEFAGGDVDRYPAQDGAAVDVDFQVPDCEHHGVLRLPTTVAMMCGSEKNGPGGRSASTLPSASAMTRSEYAATRSMSCSTRMMALIPAALAAPIRVRIRACFSAVETPEVGSSSRMTSGRSAKADATSSSFFSPCDSSRAMLASLSAKPKMPAISRTR